MSINFSEALVRSTAIDLKIDTSVLPVKAIIDGVKWELQQGWFYGKTKFRREDIIDATKMAISELAQYPDFYIRMEKLEKTAEIFWRNRQRQCIFLDRSNQNKNQVMIVKDASFIRPNDITEVGDIIGINWQKVSKKDFETGIKLEMVHGNIDCKTTVHCNNLVLIGKLVAANMVKYPDYYERLEQLYKEATLYWQQNPVPNIFTGGRAVCEREPVCRDYQLDKRFISC